MYLHPTLRIQYKPYGCAKIKIAKFWIRSSKLSCHHFWRPCFMCCYCRLEWAGHVTELWRGSSDPGEDGGVLDWKSAGQKGRQWIWERCRGITQWLIQYRYVCARKYMWVCVNVYVSTYWCHPQASAIWYRFLLEKRKGRSLRYPTRMLPIWSCSRDPHPPGLSQKEKTQLAGLELLIWSPCMTFSQSGRPGIWDKC